MYEEAQELHHAIGDRLGEANARKAIGDVQWLRDDYEAASVSYEQALALYQAMNSKLGEADVYVAMGRLAAQQEQYECALNLLTDAYELYQSIQDSYDQGGPLYYRSFVYEATGNNAQAVADMQEAVNIAEQIKHPWADEWRLRLAELQEENKE